MRETSTAVRLRDPEDLVGIIPYLTGYHPADSIVVLFLTANDRIRAVNVAPLPIPMDVAVEIVGANAARMNATAVVIVGYAPRSASSTVKAFAERVSAIVEVSYACLVAADRLYCLIAGCGCAATTGVPVDPRATAVAAAATLRGEVALASREDLMALAAPDPAANAAIARAMVTARTQATPDRAELVGCLAVAQHRWRLTDSQAARLTVLLQDEDLRTRAWLLTDDQMWLRDLWLDLTRRVPDPHVAAPAALAAWCTWRRGEAPLALAAAERSLAADPGNRLAGIVSTMAGSHVPPDILQEWPPRHLFS